MILFECLCLSLLWTGSHQNVLVSSVSEEYTINPNYGNLSMSGGNATHLGEVNIWFSHRISAFLVTHMFKSNEGKIMFKATSNSCDKKEFKNMKRMRRLTLGLYKKDTDYFPATWICPIEKGALKLKSKVRDVKFTLYVPSMLTTVGNYQRHEYYETESNGKPEQFLSSIKYITGKLEN